MVALDFYFLDYVRRVNKRQLYSQVLKLELIISTILMLWKGLIVVTNCTCPILFVLSSGMEPASHRGDILFLTNYEEESIRVGEIVVFKVEGRGIPIAHRVIRAHEKKNGTVKFLTKGDDNIIDDRGLYAPGQLWLEKKDVIGKARGLIPYVGIVSIIMNDYPIFKYSILAYIGFIVLTRRG
ncbi:hypothetical protein FSP39_013336 [Pinctada imbricata]|uniref:Signal peptidase complex catalytic subunit SEC11 n=1 Tax=Pinctada imbricata TaxID=66713 RepID=A0AA89C1E0_PINIB|nr:hypothetical protein FSP39_013336 [Pinctada imbricata]